VASPDQVSSELHQESVILDLKSGMYFGLNPVGARIWQLVQQPASVDAIIQTILDEYDVAPAQCEADVMQLLGKLDEAGLISTTSA
jgi:hypothetical protein